MLNERGIITFAIAGITAIFLSSVVSVGAAEYKCNQRQVDEGECLALLAPWGTGAPPVKYTDFDISKQLDPWEDIMVMQLAIDAFDRFEENERLALLRLRTADKFVWDLSGSTLGVIGFLLVTIAGLIGFAVVKRDAA